MFQSIRFRGRPKLLLKGKSELAQLSSFRLDRRENFSDVLRNVLRRLPNLSCNASGELEAAAGERVLGVRSGFGQNRTLAVRKALSRKASSPRTCRQTPAISDEDKRLILLVVQCG
ncbi:hypothetical protein [Paraburkholderia tuberum]|uniref:hypothetical protein n=1 Tax=Paraburkholderia tuberum TaxID=157910 RepID=UPI00115F8A97|nr:hypothetical protein [Paraburkholderia tuberum]